MLKLSQDYTLIFIVDELDRCIPEYAIKVLERLHHIADGVQNMVTIIATDKTRLVVFKAKRLNSDQCFDLLATKFKKHNI